MLGLGSGIIIDRRGYILTNAHVVQGVDRIKVALVVKTRWLVALVVAIATVGPVAAHVDVMAQVIIENDRLEPRTLETLTGQRVNFVNRTGHPVHLQFSSDVRQHEVIQIPATGPVWAIFHLPGTHPYIVHIYGRETRALDGVISVTADETHQWQSRTCDVVVEGNCIAEP